MKLIKKYNVNQDFAEILNETALEAVYREFKLKIIIIKNKFNNHIMNPLTQKQQAITNAITAFVKEADKQGQQGIISAGLNDAIFAAFNQKKYCLTSQNLELLRSSFNNWHEGNEDLLKAFTQANELYEITKDIL